MRRPGDSLQPSRPAVGHGWLRTLIRCGAALTLTVVGMAGFAGERLPEMEWAPVNPEPLSEEEKEGMAHAMAMTPYTLLLVHTRVTIEPIPSGREQANPRHGELPVVTEERRIYEARVLETLRGPALKRVRYEVVVDSGDSMTFPAKPVIVMLCRGPRGFYWGGVGAYFHASREALALARSLAKEVASKPASKFDYCD